MDHNGHCGDIGLHLELHLEPNVTLVEGQILLWFGISRLDADLFDLLRLLGRETLGHVHDAQLRQLSINRESVFVGVREPWATRESTQELEAKTMALTIGVEDVPGSLEADVGALTVEWAPCGDQDVGQRLYFLILSLPERIVLMTALAPKT